MAVKVAPVGLVVATDLDTRFLDGLHHPNLTARRHDIRSDALEAESFDLIHARAVLEHLADPQEIVKLMVRALKPGGWLVVEDADLGEPMVAARAAYVYPAVFEPAFTHVARAFARLFAQGGGNPDLAPRLPDVLAKCGLEDVNGETRIHLVRPGSAGARFMDLSLQHLGDKLLAAGLVSEEDLAGIRQALTTQDARWLSNAMTAVCGRKPGAGLST
jgi:SAM-dependent methyltransferase